MISVTNQEYLRTDHTCPWSCIFDSGLGFVRLVLSCFHTLKIRMNGRKQLQRIKLSCARFSISLLSKAAYARPSRSHCRHRYGSILDWTLLHTLVISTSHAKTILMFFPHGIIEMNEFSVVFSLLSERNETQGKETVELCYAVCTPTSLKKQK